MRGLRKLPRYMLHVIVFAVDSSDTSRTSIPYQCSRTLRFQTFQNPSFDDFANGSLARRPRLLVNPGQKGVGLTEDKKDQFMIQGSKNWSSDLKFRKSRNLFRTDRKCPFVQNEKGLELRSIELKFFENRKF